MRLREVGEPLEFVGERSNQPSISARLACGSEGLYIFGVYKIVGADQREYGPITSDQIREWIAQGRANGQTLASFEGSPWKPLSTYPEFADALRTVVPPPVAPGIP